MRKTFLKVSILGMLTVGMAAGFTSCKDYDDDIDNLQTQIDAIKSSLKEIQDLVSNGVIINDVKENGDGITISMSNGKTYNITNGKPGAPGKDAVVWSIVKNAEGKYVWAQDGVATEFPAQGEPGAPGAGIYYVPNKDGFFYKVEDGKDPVKTDIPCFAPGALTAVDDGSNIIISGILDKDGNVTEPFVLSKTGALSSLEFIPDLYVDGIETMRAQYATGNYVDPKTVTSDITGLTSNIATTGTTTAAAAVAKNQVVAFATSDDEYTDNADNKAKYILNPANANLTGISYAFKTNVAEVMNTASRADEDIISVVGKPDKDAEGNLVVDFTIADYAAIFDRNGNIEDANGDPIKNMQTVAALVATLPDNSVVASNFVAVETQNIEFSKIQYHYASGNKWQDAYQNANATTTDNVLTGDFTKVLKLPYNSVSNLPDYLRIAYTDGYFTLAQIAEKYGYTMNYSLLTYTIGANATSENMYGEVSADGKFQPKYVNAAGQSVNVTSEAGRSAIGRQPIVVLQLKDAEGNVVLGGFVKIVLTEKATVAEPINLGNVALGYLCNYKKAAAWDVFAGQVVEATGMTITEFQNNYELVENHLGVVVDGNIVDVDVTALSKANLAANAATGETAQWNNFGTFTMADAEGGSATQQFTFTINQTQAKNWYPKYAEKDGEIAGFKKGDQIGVGAMTKTPVNKTLYAKFYNSSNNSILWVGYTVTLTGVPTVTYNGQLVSQWNADKTIVPVHPGSVAYKDTEKANLIMVGTGSLWTEGKPALSFAAPYSTDDKSANYVGTTAVDYTFAVAQPSITTNEIFGIINGKVVYKTYGFIGAGTKLYGVNIVKNDGTLLTGDDLTAKLKAATQSEANLFATLSGTPQSFKIEAKDGMINDVVNSAAFTKVNPENLFKIEMNLTYGSCGITVPNFGSFDVAVGRPINITIPTTVQEVTDASDKLSAPLAAVAEVKDWQGNPFWKTSTDKNGKLVVTEGTVNGNSVMDYWLGGGELVFGWDDIAIDAKPTEAQYKQIADVLYTGTSDKFSEAKQGVREGIAVLLTYGADKKLGSVNAMVVKNFAGLNNNLLVNFIKWDQGASTITEPFYVFVPVKAKYVWGTSNIGYAPIKVKPTPVAE